MTTLNHTSSHNYKLLFDKLPDVEFYLSEFTMPTISVDQASVATPTFTVPQPGSRITYDPVTLLYSLDEDWKTWLSLYDWVTGFATDNGFPAPGQGETVSNATLLILNNHNMPIHSVEFGGIFPINVESPSMTQQIPTYTDVTLSATFVIQGLNFIRKEDE